MRMSQAMSSTRAASRSPVRRSKSGSAMRTGAITIRAIQARDRSIRIFRGMGAPLLMRPAATIFEPSNQYRTLGARRTSTFD